MAGGLPASPHRRGRPTNRTRHLLGLVAVLLVASACEVDVRVDVTMQRAGGGEVAVSVVLDADAVDHLGGDLDEVLELDDLRAGGWAVEGPVEVDDGGAAVSARKAFGSPAQAEEVIAEIAGEAGMLRDVSLGRSMSLGRTEWWFEAVGDLSGGLEAFGDDEIAAELDGLPVGRPVEDLEDELGRPLSEVVNVDVGVRMPEGSEARWQVPFGGEPVEIAATASERRTEVYVWLGIGATLVVLFVVLMVVRLLLRRRRPTGAHRAA